MNDKMDTNHMHNQDELRWDKLLDERCPACKRTMEKLVWGYSCKAIDCDFSIGIERFNHVCNNLAKKFS